MSALLVIVPERISAWIAKGEVIDRYYNPGDLFDDVHLLLLNDDQPAAADMQRLVGRARPHVHHHPVTSRLFLESLGWRPALLRRWARPVVELARTIRPDLVRCYSPHLNVLAALEIKRAIGIPYVVSLHINPDEDVRNRARGWRQRVTSVAVTAVEEVGLRHADLVLPVYRPIVPYLERLGIERYEVAYNVLNAKHIQPKAGYELHRQPRLICVGNQFAAKDPTAIVRALAALPEVELTLVGDGELHEGLRQLACELGVGDRVRFLPAVPNDELCALLADHDLFVVSTQYWELSKAILEALLTGLPVVLNRRDGAPVPELGDDLVAYVDGSPDGYRDAIAGLLTDDVARAALGQRGRAAAEAAWSPARTEAHVVDLYRRLLGAPR